MSKIIQRGKNNLYIAKNYGSIHISGVGDIKIPHQLTYLPKIDKSLIIGRESDSEKINEILSQLSGDKPLQLYGFGGIGKTTLAKYYLNEYHSSFKHFAYIEARGPIKNSFINTISLVDCLGLHDDIKGKGTNTKFELIINRLRLLEGPNLLVIDGVGDDVEYEEVFNSITLSDKWKVLVTSRDKLDRLLPFEVGALNSEQLKTLFYQYYHYDSNDKIVDDIIKLTNHTLTIEVIAKTSEVRMFKLEEILEFVKKKPQLFQLATQEELRLPGIVTEP